MVSRYLDVEAVGSVGHSRRACERDALPAALRGEAGKVETRRRAAEKPAARVDREPCAFPLNSRSLAEAFPVAVSLTPVIDFPPTSARASCAIPETIFAPQRSATLKSTLRPSSLFASMVIRSLFAVTESICFPSATEALAFA